MKDVTAGANVSDSRIVTLAQASALYIFASTKSSLKALLLICFNMNITRSKGSIILNGLAYEHNGVFGMRMA